MSFAGYVVIEKSLLAYPAGSKLCPVKVHPEVAGPL